MSTRGFLGFQSAGRVVITYNHSDSYPSWLGRNVGEFVRSIAGKPQEREYAAKAAALHTVDAQATPGVPDLIKHQYSHLCANVSTGADWYSILRELQGDPQAILDEGITCENPDFPKDSLFCEWGYLIDFDARVVEVYEGFNKRPVKTGRWTGGRSQDGYGPVRLIDSLPFDSVTPDWFETLEKEEA